MNDMLGTQRAHAKVLVQRAIDALPEKTHLIYVNQGDQLTEEQVEHLLDGDDESLWDSLANFESESQWYGIKYLFEDAMRDEEERDIVRDDEESWQRFQEECVERDESNYLRDLMRGTPAPMVKYSLNHDVDPDSWSWPSDEIEESARAIAEAAGVDFQTNHAALRSLVIEASYGGSLHVLHRTDLTDLYPTRPAKAVFTDPYLLVHDTMNGSGHMEQIKGEVTLAIGDDTLRLDTGRMSWSDDIAGIVHSACETPVKFIKEDENEDHA